MHVSIGELTSLSRLSSIEQKGRTSTSEIEEDHIDWLEALIDQIKQMGIQLYMAEQGNSSSFDSPADNGLINDARSRSLP